MPSHRHVEAAPWDRVGGVSRAVPLLHELIRGVDRWRALTPGDQRTNGERTT